MIEELASELGLGPNGPVHAVLHDWIRHTDGKLNLLGFVKLVDGPSHRPPAEDWTPRLQEYLIFSQSQMNHIMFMLLQLQLPMVSHSLSRRLTHLLILTCEGSEACARWATTMTGSVAGIR